MNRRRPEADNTGKNGTGGGNETKRRKAAEDETAAKPHFTQRADGIQNRKEDDMNETEIIKSLRSGNPAEKLAAAEAAADALEEMEERLCIMGETLTQKEWEATETEAKRRTREKAAGAAEARNDLPWYGDTPEEQEAQRQEAERINLESLKFSAGFPT